LKGCACNHVAPVPTDSSQKSAQLLRIVDRRIVTAAGWRQLARAIIDEILRRLENPSVDGIPVDVQDRLSHALCGLKIERLSCDSRMSAPGRTEPDTISIKRSPKHAQLVMLYLDRAASRTLPVSVATPFPAIGGRRFAIYPARASECLSGHAGGRVLIVTQQPARSQSAASFCYAAPFHWFGTFYQR
jgi:hypothetical protein